MLTDQFLPQGLCCLTSQEAKQTGTHRILGTQPLLGYSFYILMMNSLWAFFFQINKCFCHTFLKYKVGKCPVRCHFHGEGIMCPYKTEK